MVRSALKYYPELKQDEVRFVLVEATQRILPEIGPDMVPTPPASCASAASTCGSARSWSPASTAT